MQQQSWIDAALALPWIAWSIGGLLVALGAVLLWFSLLADRSRGRRRCPKCWYDMRGTAGLRCSECGYSARREKALHRTRRRWRGATLALLSILAGGALLLAPQVHRDGWIALVPTTVLLWYVPPSGDDMQASPHWAAVELDRRNAAASLWSWQWRYLLTDKNGLRFRPVWPADQPLVVETTRADWGHDWLADPREPGKAGILPEHIHLISSYSHRLHLPRPTPGVLPQVDVLVIPMVRLPGRPAPSAGTFWSGRVELPVRVVPTMREAMTRRAGPEFDQLMRRAIRIYASADGYTNAGGAVSDAVLRCVLNRKMDARLNNIAFGVGVRVFQGDRFVRAFAGDEGWDLQPLPAEEGSAGLGTSQAGTSRITLDELRTATDWKFEIRTDPLRALCDWERSEYWDGVIELTSTHGLWVQGRDSPETRAGPR